MKAKVGSRNKKRALLTQLFDFSNSDFSLFQMFQSKTALITGITGQDGSYLPELCRYRKCSIRDRVRLLVRRTTP